VLTKKAAVREYSQNHQIALIHRVKKINKVKIGIGFYCRKPKIQVGNYLAVFKRYMPVLRIKKLNYNGKNMLNGDQSTCFTNVLHN
jgi:hypothetical protein